MSKKLKLLTLTLNHIYSSRILRRSDLTALLGLLLLICSHLCRRHYNQCMYI